MRDLGTGVVGDERKNWVVKRILHGTNSIAHGLLLWERYICEVRKYLLNRLSCT